MKLIKEEIESGGCGGIDQTEVILFSTETDKCLAICDHEGAMRAILEIQCLSNFIWSAQIEHKTVRPKYLPVKPNICIRLIF